MYLSKGAQFEKDIIAIDDGVDLALLKLREVKYLFVLDGLKVVSILSLADIADYIKTAGSTNNIAVNDISKKQFRYATFETIWEDLEKFKYCEKLPLLNTKGELVAILYWQSLEKYFAWNKAQTFEMDWWEENAVEYFANFPNYSFIPKAQEFISECWCEKACLEIGAGPICGYMVGMKEAKRRIIIEPLADEYAALRKKLSFDLDTDGIEFYLEPADYYIAELRDCIDGLIVCQNALDHTPNWMFVLSNIALYAKSGAHLYLHIDIHYGFGEHTGHFCITPDPKQFFRLIESLGFELLYTEFSGEGKNGFSFGENNIYVCVVAKKR